MDMSKRWLVILALVATTRYVCATDMEDIDTSLSNPIVQQLSTRLSALEDQGRIQQHRIAELEARDLAQQKQNEILQRRITELESHDIAQQTQNEIQQQVISELKVAVRNQQQQMDELNHTVIEISQAYHNLQDVLTVHDEETNAMNIKELNADSSTDVHRIRARREQPEVDNVAFTAILVHSSNNMGLNQNVVFDKVETNIGNAYNPHHGVFTAPVAGTYVFHVTIHSYNGAASWCKIVVNGVNKADVYSKGFPDQNSQTLIVYLNQGDDVAIQNNHDHYMVFGDGNLWTTFSGFLLRSDADFNTMIG